MRASESLEPRLSGPRTGRALPVVVAAVGVVISLAGIEHGVGELMQTNTHPESVFIESWPDVAALEPLGGEPAMTLIPDLRVAGAVTIFISLLSGWWAMRARARRGDGGLLLGLSTLLLLVGGGFGPPLMGLLLGFGLLRAAQTPPPGRSQGKLARALARRWRGLLVLTVGSFLALVPSVVVLSWWTGADSLLLTSLLPPVAFTALLLARAAAMAHDRADATHGVEAR